MPYQGTPTGPRPSAIDRSPRPGSSLAALMLLAAGCAAAEESPTELRTASLQGCAGGGPADGKHVAVNDMLEAMARDLRTVDDGDREDVRYVTLAHLHNAGASSACMETYRAAMNLALNSVSRGLRPARARQVDDRGTVYRIELEDHGWDAATWQRLVAGYPYNVRYDGDSWLLPFRDDLADDLRAETASAVPYVYGDWLVAVAVQPPLYYGLLELPATLDELEAQLGIDTVAATEDERVDRAGFVASGVSTASRMIARFALPGAGALWASCDIARRGRGEDILTDPIEPICESREIVFALPNGLPAFYVADAAGVRQDMAPRSLVTDPGRADGAVIAGISCASCHGATGIITRQDEVRDHALTSGADDIERILALYPSRDEMRRLVEADQRGFAAARRAAGVPDAPVEPLTWVSDQHERTLGRVEAAAALGLDPEMFGEALDASGAQVPAAAMVLRQDDGRISRATWNQIYPDMVEGLGLGMPCDPDGAGSCP